jgi:hypothetical protein
MQITRKLPIVFRSTRHNCRPNFRGHRTLVQKQKLRLVNRINWLAQLSHRPRHERRAVNAIPPTNTSLAGFAFGAV